MLLVPAMVLVASGVASAAFNDHLVIRDVDTKAYPRITVSVLVDGPTPNLGDFTIRENGVVVNGATVVPVNQSQLPIGTALVIDTAASMAANNKLAFAKAAANKYIDQMKATDQACIVAFSDKARLVVALTKDKAKLRAAVNSLTASGHTALWDGIGLGSVTLGQHPELQANLIVVDDGRDDASSLNNFGAAGTVIDNRVQVFAIGLQGGTFDQTALSGLAVSRGGVFDATDDPHNIDALYQRAETALRNQYQISYTTSAKGTISLQVSAAGLAATTSINTGVSTGAAGPTATVVKGPGFAPSPYLIGLLVLLAVGLAIYAVARLVVREESDLSVALSPYGEEGQGAGVGDGRPGREIALAQTSIMQRVVAVTQRIGEERGFLPRLERALERADLPLQAAEALSFYIIGALLVTVVAFVAGGTLTGLIVLALAVIFPPAALSYLAGRRQKIFTSQLPDMLQLLSGTLRAGFSLLQGVEAVSQETADPMGRELRRVLTEARLGRPLEEAMTDCADRMGSLDFAWAVMAIKIQREVGGNLAELLATVADTMIARERLRREVQALTAEGRISAIVLFLLPIGLGAVLYLLNPKYIRVLFHNHTGQIMMGVALGLAGVGFWWMQKMIKIEI